jgi:hypothetical protein
MIKIPIEGEGIVKDLICYCLEYSVDDINQDYLENGKSTIMKKYKWKKSLEIACVRPRILRANDA